MATRNEGTPALATAWMSPTKSQPTAALYCLADTDFSKSKDTHVFFTYLNEGGANVVFKIHKWQQVDTRAVHRAYFATVSSHSKQPAPKRCLEFTSKVLRVNKGLRKTLRCDEVIKGFYNDIRPLFMPGSINIIGTERKTDSHQGTSFVTRLQLPHRDYSNFLMEHQLVTLSPNVMEDLTSMSNAIRQEAGSTALHSTRYGILLPDMSSNDGSSITLEIKPKWLLQSPNAPASAQRCRTCALQSTKKRDPDYLCPLWLFSGHQEVLKSWLIPKIIDKLSTSSNQADEATLLCEARIIAKHLVNFLVDGNGLSILQHLRMLQSKLDPSGVLCRRESHVPDLFDRNLRLAMTLRDCSMYIKINRPFTTVEVTESSTRIECRLGDLDFKSADKIDDWESKEHALIEGDAYTKEIPEDVCFLHSTQRER